MELSAPFQPFQLARRRFHAGRLDTPKVHRPGRIAPILGDPAKLLPTVKIFRKFPSCSTKEVVCYPISVTRSTPLANFFSRRSNLITIALFLCLIALLSQRNFPPNPDVNISGLRLGDSAAKVEESLGYASFREVRGGTTLWEYWGDSPGRSLTVWIEHDRVVRLDGGLPEVDGETALSCDLSTLRHKLGPPANQGLSGERGREGHNFLSYPKLRLLIQRKNGTNRFILFKTG